MNDGFLLLNKQPGITSFQALKEIKKTLNTERVGHGGTLDRFAEGLLVVLVGRLTRLAAFVSELDKEYIARITFGRETDTLDPEGAIIATAEIPPFDLVKQAIPRFIGEIDQVPPRYSAVHVGGKRSSWLARKGESPKLESRRVVVFRIDVLDYTPPELTVNVQCSKGTYIRSLARDLGQACTSCASVSWLKRTRIGPFQLGDAVRGDEFRINPRLIPASVFFERNTTHIRLTVKDQFVHRVKHGAKLDERIFCKPPEADGVFGLFDGSGELCAMVEKKGPLYRYLAVLAGVS